MERGNLLTKGRGAFFASILMTALCAGCGQKDDAKSKGAFACKSGSISEDQKESFTDPVKAFPLGVGIPVSSPTNLSNAAERAAGEWNRVSGSVGVSDAFRVSSVEDRDIQMDCGSIVDLGLGGDKVRISLVDLSDHNQLRTGLSENLLAVTVRCLRGEEREIQGQVLFFRSQLIPPAQLQSVVTHELGHTLGLDHSCTTSRSSAKYRGCSEVDAGHPYVKAVMFPTLQLGNGPSGQPQIKESLQQNDVDRFQCLY